MRKVVKFFEQKGGVGSQNSEGFGANQATSQTVEQGWQFYMEALVGKGNFQKIEIRSRGVMCNSGKQLLKGLESIRRIEAQTMLGNHEVGKASVKKTITVLEGVSNFWMLRDILITSKEEVY
jgi:hypothetical protein